MKNDCLIKFQRAHLFRRLMNIKHGIYDSSVPLSGAGKLIDGNNSNNWSSGNNHCLHTFGIPQWKKIKRNREAEKERQWMMQEGRRMRTLRTPLSH